MNMLKIGKRYINFSNVTEVIPEWRYKMDGSGEKENVIRIRFVGDETDFIELTEDEAAPLMEYLKMIATDVLAVWLEQRTPQS